MDRLTSGFDDPSFNEWNEETNGNDLLENVSSNLLRGIVCKEFTSSEQFPAHEGHCYVNEIEKLILEEVFERNIKVEASLDLTASVDDPQSVFESEVLEFKEAKYDKSRYSFSQFNQTIQAYFGRYLCAFKNHRGGILLIGVSDKDKIVSGVRLSTQEVDYIQTFFYSKLVHDFHPAELVSWNNDIKLDFINIPSSEDSSKTYLYIIALAVFRGRPFSGAVESTPYLTWEGKAFIRKGNTVQQVPSHQIQVDINELYMREEAAALGPDALLAHSHKINPTTVANKEIINDCILGAGLMTKALSLPIERYREIIKTTVSENRVTIITGGTGCGKSSMVPLYLWRDKTMFVSKPRILISQPKRVTTVKIAEYFARLNATPLGYHVGYQIGGRNMTSPFNIVTFCTNGILYEKLRKMKKSENLPYDLIILDEAHEGDIHGTVVLPLLLEQIRKQPSKKLIIMSATLLITPLRDYLNRFRIEIEQTGEIPIINIDNRQFSIQEVFIDDPLLKRFLPIGFTSQEIFREEYCKDPYHTIRLSEKTWDVVANIVDNVGKSIFKNISRLEINQQHLHRGKSRRKPYSSILIFVPGLGALRQLQSALLERHEEKKEEKKVPLYDIVLIHSSFPYDDLQKSIDAPVPSMKHRRIYISTNICESSLTLPDVRLVIDSCTQRLGIYNPTQYRTILTEQWYGKVNGIQRAGRVGRTSPGVVVRMVPKTTWEWIRETIPPEIMRCDLSELLLGLLDGTQEVTPYSLLMRCQSHPEPSRISAALANLVRGECLSIIKDTMTSDESSSSINFRNVPHTVFENMKFKLTPLGRVLMQIPGSIETGRILLAGATLGLAREACVIAALLLKPFPVIRTLHRPVESFVSIRQFALGCRSDSIAGYNAYCYWLRNRREERRRRCEQDASHTWQYHEYQWLHEEMFLSPFALAELDDFVLIFRKSLAVLGLLEQPTRDEIERARGLVDTQSHNILQDECSADDHLDLIEEEDDDEEEEDEEYYDNEATSRNIVNENRNQDLNVDHFFIDDILSIFGPGMMTVDPTYYNVTSNRDSVGVAADALWMEEKDWRHHSTPTLQYQWYQKIIQKWEPAGCEHVEQQGYDYLHFYDAMGHMDKRCFGVYIMLTYGLKYELFMLSPTHVGSSHELICQGFTSERCSLHFDQRGLSQAKITFKTSAEDIKTNLQIDTHQYLAVIKNRHNIEINPLVPSSLIKTRYDFAPLQPVTGLFIQTEHLACLPLKRTSNQYPIGWPARPQLSPSIRINFTNNQRFIPGNKLYVTDMSVCNPLTYLNNVFPAAGDTNIACSQGLMVCGKIVPSGPKTLHYDIATIFPDNLNGAFYLIKLIITSKSRIQRNDSNMLINLVIDDDIRLSTDLNLHLKDLTDVLQLNEEFHKCLAFTCINTINESSTGNRDLIHLTNADFLRYQNYCDHLRIEQSVKLPKDMLSLLYDVSWRQKIVWVV